MPTWEIKRVVREPVYRLFLDGEFIRDEDGRPVDYDTEEHAQHVAANWDSYRAPTLAELRGMPDEELQRRASGEHFPISPALQLNRQAKRLIQGDWILSDRFQTGLIACVKAEIILALATLGWLVTFSKYGLWPLVGVT